MGGSQSQLQSSKSHQELAQREFFLRRRNPTNESSSISSIEAKIEVCKEAKSIAEMATILPSKDLKLLASLSNGSFASPSDNPPTILQPTAVYPTSHPQIFTSLPPNRALSVRIDESSSPHSNASSPSLGYNLQEEDAPLHTLYQIAALEADSPSPLPTRAAPNFANEHSPQWRLHRASNLMPPSKKYKLQ